MNIGKQPGDHIPEEYTKWQGRISEKSRFMVGEAED